MVLKLLKSGFIIEGFTPCLEILSTKLYSIVEKGSYLMILQRAFWTEICACQGRDQRFCMFSGREHDNYFWVTKSLFLQQIRMRWKKEDAEAYALVW